MALDETILESLAKDGTMDYEKWPSLLDPLLERLEHIVHHEFPLPRAPQNSYETVSTAPLASESQINSQTNSNKENAPPSQNQTPLRPPPVPLFSSPSSERVSDSQPPSGPADDALPPPLSAILTSVKTTLKNSFSTKPPHTIQRIAELILHPTVHHKTVPSYLRALDRVVSVSSGADVFPLPHTAPLPGTTIDGPGIDGVNGVGNTSFIFTDTSLGSDESLGGALLTPIPWLDSSAITEEDRGAFAEAEINLAANASVPVSQGGDAMDQDHPMHDDQQNSASSGQQAQNQQQQSLNTESGGPPANTEDPEEIPHARGPSVLGVEDLGLQDGKGVKMTLDTNPGSTAAAPSVSTGRNDEKRNEDATPDADGDVVLADAQEKASTEDSDQKKVESAASGSGA